MIVSGIILRNVHDGHIIAGLKPSWSKEFRGIALAIIFLRSGLELDLGVSYRMSVKWSQRLLLPFPCPFQNPITKASYWIIKEAFS